MPEKNKEAVYSKRAKRSNHSLLRYAGEYMFDNVHTGEGHGIWSESEGANEASALHQLKKRPLRSYF